MQSLVVILCSLPALTSAARTNRKKKIGHAKLTGAFEMQGSLPHSIVSPPGLSEVGAREEWPDPRQILDDFDRETIAFNLITSLGSLDWEQKENNITKQLLDVGIIVLGATISAVNAPLAVLWAVGQGLLSSSFGDTELPSEIMEAVHLLIEGSLYEFMADNVRDEISGLMDSIQLATQTGSLPHWTSAETILVNDMNTIFGVCWRFPEGTDCENWQKTSGGGRALVYQVHLTKLMLATYVEIKRKSLDTHDSTLANNFSMMASRIGVLNTKACDRLQRHLSVFKPDRMNKIVTVTNPGGWHCPYYCYLWDTLPHPSQKLYQRCCSSSSSSFWGFRYQFVQNTTNQFDALEQEIDTLQRSNNLMLWKISERGVDLCPNSWSGSSGNTFAQCKSKALEAGARFFAWTAEVHGGFCKVSTHELLCPLLFCNEGNGIKLYELENMPDPCTNPNT